MFIQSPQDIFYLVTSVIVAVLGVLLIALVLYVILLVRRGGEVAKQVKEKLMSPGVYLAGILAAVMKGVNLVRKSGEKKKEQ